MYNNVYKIASPLCKMTKELLSYLSLYLVTSLIGHCSFLQTLLQRYLRLEGEIKAYEEDINRLNQLATLMTKASNVHNVSLYQR